MMNKAILILIFSYILESNAFCQKITEADVIQNIKMKIFIDNSNWVVKNELYKNLLNTNLEVEKLKSNGFGENFLFYKILPQTLIIDTVGEKIYHYNIPKCINGDTSCYYIFVYIVNNNKLLNLIGSNHNEFVEFYNLLEGVVPKWKPINKIKNSDISKFSNNYVVEDLDLKCLLNSFNSKNSPCLEPITNELKVW